MSAKQGFAFEQCNDKLSDNDATNCARSYWNRIAQQCTRTQHNVLRCSVVNSTLVWAINMNVFLDDIPNSEKELNEPTLEFKESERKRHHAAFESKSMKLSVRDERNNEEGKNLLTSAIFHGMVREIMKHASPGKATMNLINCASALTEHVESSTEFRSLARHLFWMFLHNLKENRRFVEGKNPPPFDKCEQGKAFAQFQI